MYFLFNRTTLQIFCDVPCRCSIHELFAILKNQQENRIRSKLFVAS